MKVLVGLLITFSDSSTIVTVSKVLVLVNCPNRPWFLCVCSRIILKTLWEKGEIACNKQFLLFPQCFLPGWRTFCYFHQF